MLVYRMLERVKLIHRTSNEPLNNCKTCMATILRVVLVSFAMKRIRVQISVRMSSKEK